MRFTYQARTPEGELRQGLVEAPTIEIAISSLQRKNLIIISVLPEEEKHGAFGHPLSLFEHVSTKEIVILSRQMATLFQAKVPVVESLKIIAEETDNYLLKKELGLTLSEVAEILNRKDHTTALHAQQKISNLILRDPNLKKEVDTIVQSLTQTT